jgi:hypothetical protein
LGIDEHAALHTCREEFREVRHLGGGSSSKVLCAKHRFDGLEYAIKRSRHPVASELDAKRWQQVWPRLP